MGVVMGVVMPIMTSPFQCQTNAVWSRASIATEKSEGGVAVEVQYNGRSGLFFLRV